MMCTETYLPIPCVFDDTWSFCMKYSGQDWFGCIYIPVYISSANFQDIVASLCYFVFLYIPVWTLLWQRLHVKNLCRANNLFLIPEFVNGCYNSNISRRLQTNTESFSNCSSFQILIFRSRISSYSESFDPSLKTKLLGYFVTISENLRVDKYCFSGTKNFEFLGRWLISLIELTKVPNSSSDV